MAALAPHLRFRDPARQERLRRRTYSFAARKVFEERGRIVTIEAFRIQRPRDRLQCGDGGANLLEHASSRG
jgi:hypothetical protein